MAAPFGGTIRAKVVLHPAVTFAHTPAQRTFTIWVRSEQQVQTRIVVYGATNVNAAIRQALDQAARAGPCDAETLTIYGIAEGDIADLDRETPQTKA
jgi:hypothetical protein